MVDLAERLTAAANGRQDWLGSLLYEAASYVRAGRSVSGISQQYMLHQLIAQGIEAAAADETQRGSAEGESPVGNADAPNYPTPTKEQAQ